MNLLQEDSKGVLSEEGGEVLSSHSPQPNSVHTEQTVFSRPLLGALKLAPYLPPLGCYPTISHRWFTPASGDTQLAPYLFEVSHLARDTSSSLLMVLLSTYR
jgi:hypothetical protein